MSKNENEKENKNESETRSETESEGEIERESEGEIERESEGEIERESESRIENKVSIGVRGWRFDEDEVFTDEGEYRDFTEMDDDVRNRLIRLSVVVGETCDACWLETDDPDEHRTVEYVYGEPLSEVLVCEEHEPDFVYWFREVGGNRYAGTDEFDDRFHGWFLDGGRAPDWYEGMVYVEDGEDLPAPPTPDPEYLEGHVAEGKPEKRIDLREGSVEEFPEERDRSTTVDDDLDLSVDYPNS